MSDAPTLEAKAARIDLLGQPLLARLELTSNAERLALLGDWSALFRLLSGEAQLAAGTLRIAGVDVPQGVVQGAVGFMRLEPLLPGAWTSEQLLTSSAELAGTPQKSAQKLAFETLEQLGLVELAARRLAHHPARARRRKRMLRRSGQSHRTRDSRRRRRPRILGTEFRCRHERTDSLESQR